MLYLLRECKIAFRRVSHPLDRATAEHVFRLALASSRSPASPAQIRPVSNRFLIHCPELDSELTDTKHLLDLVSNRQFFAFLKVPNTARTDRNTNLTRACCVAGTERVCDNDSIRLALCED